MTYRKNPLTMDELRRQAKARLLALRAVPDTEFSDSQALHQLEASEIHQIELEIENEHLSRTREQLELALAQSSELYDFAPVGMVLLNSQGVIVKLNLIAANLLGEERVHLLGSHLASLIAQPDRPTLNGMLENATAFGEILSRDIAIEKSGHATTAVQISIVSQSLTSGWQVTLVDLTAKRRNEERMHLSEARWKLALEAVGAGVWDWDIQTGEVTFSKDFSKLYGMLDGEYGNRIEAWTQRIHPDDSAQVLAAVQAHLKGETASYLSEHRGRCKDGSWKWILSRGTLVSRSTDNAPLRMVGTHTDITDRKRVENAAASAARFQQAVLDSLAAKIVVLDSEGAIIQTNVAWRNAMTASTQASSLHGVGANYINALKYLCADCHDAVTNVGQGIASVVTGKVASFQLAHPFFSPPHQRWYNVAVTPVPDDAGRVVVSHEDVSDIKAAELASVALANTDSLTKALSRRNFLNLAEQETIRALRYKTPLIVLSLDLNQLKRINERYGHSAGDLVLQSFVQTVTEFLRDSDLTGRLGGDEFAVLLPNTSQEGGQALAQRIVQAVRAHPVRVGPQSVAYSVSIGLGCLSAEPSFSALLGVADTALFQVKERDRDRRDAEK